MLNGMLVSFPKKKKTKIENYIKIYEQKHTVSSIIIIMPNANKYGIRWVFSDMWRKILDLKKNPTQCFRRKTTDKLRNTGICNSATLLLKSSCWVYSQQYSQRQNYRWTSGVHRKWLFCLRQYHVKQAGLKVTEFYLTLLPTSHSNAGIKVVITLLTVSKVFFIISFISEIIIRLFSPYHKI